MKKIYALKKQGGVYAVEFAIVASVVLVMIFAAFETGRLMFTFNTLEEVSRRAARLAVVCQPDLEVVPEAPDGLKALALDGMDELVTGLTLNNLNIRYLAENGAVANTAMQIDLVSASVENYQHQLIIPGFFITLNAPGFTTTLPRESLGATRFGMTVCA
ncbi:MULTISPECIES: TadE/TadG family type IV pilus assembly protein [Marinobacter]|uniref:TadE/TadG family type IV pilus assembly protein n=1 Tax=Marinobacter suaedae TaxID=3057675 RepID=A0ABT8VXZ1_9GAMM|nr:MULTISPECIES: TadE/TadG family type IV pilus assembly protein [unclassified Marinobacter]MBZ2168918.1 pilus assembly protein [Marinobacter sp. F4216]MDO3720803.1 TadE/TadG family type IV pilus assembly protein [Marinobacter sp. chi1]